MEIFLPSWRVNSTHPVSMLNLQALSSYFIIASSNSRYRLTVYDKASEFCAVHGSLHCCTRRKRKIRTLLQSETGSDFSCLVGAGGFEPPKLKSSRFTVCPHWPLGNTPIFSFCSPWIACIYYHPDGSLSTSFAEFLDFCAESKNTKAKAAQKSTFLSGFLELVTGVEPATH